MKRRVFFCLLVIIAAFMCFPEINCLAKMPDAVEPTEVAILDLNFDLYDDVNVLLHDVSSNAIDFRKLTELSVRIAQDDAAFAENVAMKIAEAEAIESHRVR